MPNTAATSAQKRRANAGFSIFLGLAAVLLFFVASAFISYWNTRIFSRNATLVTHTHEVILKLSDLRSLAKDAETGQRGYVLTGDDSYLAPHTDAVATLEEEFLSLGELVKDNPQQKMRMEKLQRHMRNKLSELKETIDLRRAKSFEAALELVKTNRGKSEMDAIRSIIADMEMTENDLRQQRMEEMRGAYQIAVVSGILTAVLGIILSIAVAYLLRKAALTRARQEWLQSGEVGLSVAMLGELRVEQLGENILKFITGYVDAHAGALYMHDGDSYRNVATYGTPTESGAPASFELNDGLLGQAAKDGRTILVNEVPDGYLTVSSALGHGNPRHLIIAPAKSDDAVNAVLELGFIHPLDPETMTLLEQVSESIGVAVKAANYRTKLQNLLEETQRQAEELQAQGEELRVNNEELEEQSRALRESQTRLEQQQAEMEQTNAQLEEQTQLLEGQRDDIARAKAAIQLKAQELEQASQYKSDFLANMSHELRTPLNSSLILAKLLGDNPNGNLTDEQVKFAQTIQSSGNDLLALINDILDLSKIEAGHMEMRPETLPLASLARDLTSIFAPMAKQKGLTFSASVAPNAPEIMETDRLRLEQVIKNLLSNAIKFTEKGSVELTVARAEGNRVSFTVKDTGIGIANEQQQAIFEAFRQADGTISRKYGGTGLGLSISRELTRLLGGHIEIKSQPGEGSTFVVIVPEIYQSNLVTQRAATVEVKPEPKVVYEKPFYTPIKRMADDREKLDGNSRTILIVEDDESFARVLYDMSHELDFQCLIATNAEDALALAKQYIPSAVVLDIGLPDHSGLSVLDRLKRNVRTRHIPVHVVSGSDYAQTALSLGAVGYMIKPVKRDELSDALKKLETKLSQRVRRVLIVEDDAVQLDSVCKLLGSQDVETVGVGTAAECLENLKENTFDCMVLDLSLPDASGYSLLETLSREDAYSFPPVIVYTGRELTSDQEHQLRRYSKSIIIKGAKSPERLLDEVTLFLHQVVSELPPEQQRMLETARNRDAVLEGRTILIVEDDIRNVYALTSILEPRGAILQIARNGKEALDVLSKNSAIDLVLMDVMMPEMDGLTATREIRKRNEWKKLPVIMLTAKAMKDDQERCLDAGANDYMAKPLDVEKLLSLVRVWMPR